MHDTEPVTPPAAAPRHPLRVVGRYAGIALIVLGGLLSLTALLVSLNGKPAAHRPIPPRASATTFTPSPSAVTAMSTWCAGAGNAMLRHVRADMNQVGTDARAGDLAATEADGGRLTADAEAAEQLPPPVTRAQQLSYVEAMGALSFAGTDLSAGNLAAANRAIGAASGYLGQDKGILTC